MIKKIYKYYDKNFIEIGFYILLSIITILFVLQFYLIFQISSKKVSCETYYSELFIVKNVENLENSNFLVLFENNNGYQFKYISEDGDIYENEIYTAIMYNNKTEKIFDDKIISIKYQGEK